MFRHVLLPVDLSERSAESVQRYTDLLGRQAETVVLLHVVETIQGVPERELEDFYGRLRAKAEERLGAWAGELAREGVTVRHEIVFGRRGTEVVRYARQENVDLIVIGSHTLDPEQPGGIGTISHQVALFAPCSVLLLR